MMSGMQYDRMVITKFVGIYKHGIIKYLTKNKRVDFRYENEASGMGLIKCGSVVIPFDNQISKDTDLYKLYNTNIHEKIAEAKKRENQRKISVD